MSEHRPPEEEAANAWPEDDEALHVDEPDEEPPPPRSRVRLVAGWGACAVVVLALGFGLREAGRQIHNPPGRIPGATAAEAVAPGLFGTTSVMERDLQALDGFLPLQPGQGWQLAGKVERLEFPRTLGDRLFAKRDEDALLFVLRQPSGSEFRVMALRDNGTARTYAIEPPTYRQEAAEVTGFFIAVSDSETRAVLDGLMETVEAAPRQEHSWSNFTIFGPFSRGDQKALQQRIDGNIVLRHLVAVLTADGGDLSIASPAFLVLATPKDRTIRAIYYGQENLVMEPLWGESDTSSLAHELVHAYLDEVASDPAAARRQAAAYLEANQPHLYRDIVGDLYERLDGLGQAEEAIAFLIGAVAERQPTTVAPIRVLENQNLASTSAGLLKTDIEFLIEMGLLPQCMDPESLGHARIRIDFAYYDTAEKACEE